MATGLGGLVAAARAVGADDPADLSPAVLIDQVIELRRVIDGLEGTWSRLVAVLDRSGAAEAGTGAFLRSSCRLAPATARGRVVLARRLTGRPAVGGALAAGDISVDHARVVTHALEELAAADTTLAAEAEAPLLAAARQLDPARLRREIAHARHALAPEAAAAADESRHQRRHLDVASTFEGMVAVTGLLTPEGGELLMSALTPLSGPADPEDTRTPGQRRADALGDLCHRGLEHGRLPTVSGERPHLTVVVPLPALTRSPTTGVPTLNRLTAAATASTSIPGRVGTAGQSDTRNATHISTSTDVTTARNTTTPTGTTDSRTSTGTTLAQGTTTPSSTTTPRDCAGRAIGADPAEAAEQAGRGDDHDQQGWWQGIARSGGAATGEATWGAVLGPDAVRRIACDASVVRVVLDPAGQPLDVGRRTRVVPPAIRTALTVRDRGCVHPGCDRGPQWTDAHHVRHWAEGGSTSLDNLVLLCRHHHRAVHEGRAPLPHAPPRAA